MTEENLDSTEKKPRRLHTQAFRLAAVKRVLAKEEDRKTIAFQLDLHDSVLARWVREYRRSGKVGNNTGKRFKSGVHAPAETTAVVNVPMTPAPAKFQVITQSQVDMLRKELTLVKNLLKHYMEKE